MRKMMLVLTIGGVAIVAAGLLSRVHRQAEARSRAATVMAVRRAGGLDALEGEVSRRNAAIRERMRRMEAEYAAKSTLDVGRSRRVSAPASP